MHAAGMRFNRAPQPGEKTAIVMETSNDGGQERTRTVDGNDVKVLGTSVVSAVHDCSNWKTKSDLELVNSATSASTFGHDGSLDCRRKCGK
jgi:hypothetical protein